MGEDQDTERARRLDEAGRRDRLARCGRMAEAVAPARARVLAVVLLGELELVCALLEVDAEVFLVLLGLGLVAVLAVAVRLLDGEPRAVAVADGGDRNDGRPLVDRLGKALDRELRPVCAHPDDLGPA